MNQQEVRIRTGGVELEGTLRGAQELDVSPGVVAFAHGSGSSRHSPRNQAVAETLQQAGLVTLVFDLLTGEEDREDQQTRALRFDIPLLAERLTGVVDWLGRQGETPWPPIGLFGASTGAAAALISAGQRPRAVRAVVSRGGRPDLAGEALPKVEAPTLLIVGGLDQPVIGMNHQAAGAMRCEHQMRIVPDASHLFEEPGKLDEVASLARDWFTQYLSSPP